MKEIQSLFSFFQSQIQDTLKDLRRFEVDRKQAAEEVTYFLENFEEQLFDAVREEIMLRSIAVVITRYKAPPAPMLCLPEPKIERRRRERAAEMARQEVHVPIKPIFLENDQGFMW